MKCYTMQKLKSWEEAQAKGYLTGDIELQNCKVSVIYINGCSVNKEIQ